jgi:protein O-mannosyl-transferase
MQPFWRRFWICAALMAVALIAYWPVTHAEFVSWDDDKIVLQNPALDKPFMERWTTPYQGMYMPTTQTVYQLMAILGRIPGAGEKPQFNPWVFHWTMVVVRLLNIPAVFILLRRIVDDDWAVAAGTALMALHPIGDEALAWITEVSTPLGTLFAVLCLWQWMLFRQKSSKHWFHYSAAVVLYLLALTSKPMCVFVPVMAWALDACILRVNWKRSLRDLSPWLLPAAGLSIWMKSLQPPSSAIWIPPFWQRPAVAMDAVIFYLGKILVPRDFGIDYGRTPHWVLMQPRMLLLEGLATILLAGGLWLFRRHWRSPIFICAAIFFIAGMGAVLGLTPFWFQVYSTVADRYVYLPMLGIALAVAGLLAGIRNPLPWIIVTTALLVCATLTYRQVQTWHDSYALYAHAIEVHPNCWMAWDNTAYELVQDNQPVRSLPLARVAYALDSSQTDIYSSIGMVLAMQSDPRQAIPYFRRVIYSNPDDPVTAMNLGAAYTQLHQYDLGIKWLQRAVTLNPTSKKAQWLLKGAIQLRDQIHHSTAPATTQP